MSKTVKSCVVDTQKAIRHKKLFSMLLLMMLLVVTLTIGGLWGSTVNAADTGFKFSFMAISDTHGAGNSTNLTNALNDAVSNNCSAVCISGDITDTGAEAQYDNINTVVNSTPHPAVYYIAGNHDLRNIPIETAKSRFLTKTGMPALYYDQWINGYHFIFLSSEAALNDDAYMSDTQLQWLDSKLAESASLGQPIFVFRHQPLMNTVSFSYPTNYFSDEVQDQKMEDILGKYPQSILITGHLHDDVTIAGNLYNKKYCTMVRDGSVVNGQGLVVNVYGDRVEINGRSFSTHTTVWNATVNNFTGSNDTQAPSAPANLNATFVSDKTAAFTWDAAADDFQRNVGVTGYDIYNGTTLIGSTTGRTSFTATALTANTTYNFSVKAKDAAGNISGASSSLNITTSASDPIPTNIALNKTVTANQYVTAETPQNAVDGSGGTKWCSNVSGDKWLMVDLGQNYDISRWVVKHSGAGAEGLNWNTKFFKLQKSDDGTNWIDMDAEYVNISANVSNITDRYINTFTARYVRLYIKTPTNDDNGSARIYEFELYGVATPMINVALNRTAAANQYVAAEPPSKAVDGNVSGNSKWCSNVSGDKWLMLDLGQSYDISRWVVKHAGAGGEGTNWNTKDFKLQKSPDGTTWTDVDAITGNTANITDRNVSTFSSRYVRLYITAPTNDTNISARIYEFEVYGIVTPTNVALNKSASANQYVAAEAPANAVDGSVSNNSKWCSNVPGDKWLMVDLGQNYNISRWVVKHAGAGGEGTNWNTKNFKLQKSSDGISWIDVDVVTGNTANITDRYVKLFNTRYVRVYITAPTNDSNIASRIYELEIYGSN